MKKTRKDPSKEISINLLMITTIKTRHISTTEKNFKVSMSLGAVQICLCFYAIISMSCLSYYTTRPGFYAILKILSVELIM